MFSQVSISKITYANGDDKRLGAKPGELIKISIETSEDVSGALITIDGWGTTIAAEAMTLDSSQLLSYTYTVPEDTSQTDGHVEITFTIDSYSQTTLFPIADQRKPQGGGSSFNPYEVASVGNLSWVFDTGSPASQIFFKQTQDLDLLGYTWESKVNFNRVNFNRNEYTLNNFNYDGGGFSINNLLLDETVVFQDPHTSGFGLFGGMDNGSITNLTIDNAQLRIQNSGTTALNNIGILSGYMSSSFLNNVSVKNSSIDIYSGPNISNVGGISGSVGYMGLIKEVSSENNSITVRGVAANSSHQSSQVGGVFGNMNWNNARADISKIYSTNVSIDLARRAEHVGGLIGRAEYLFWYEGNNGENYSMNEVYAENFEIRITEDTKTNWNWSSSIGGLIGSTYEQDNGPIKTPELQNAFATGKIYITSPNYVGGLIGHSQNSGIKNVYAKVDIIVDLGNLSDWTSFSYGWLNDMRAGGLFGYYSYDGMPLSTSYSASNVVIQRVGFDEDQFANYFNGTNSNGRIGAIASTLDGFAAEAITNSVFYDSEVYTFNQESIGKQNQIDTPNLTSSAVGKQTADMKLISQFMKSNWDFVLEATNGTLDVWDIDNGGTTAGFNLGYPYFNYQVAGTQAVLPVIVTPNTEFSTGQIESRRTITALSPVGGNSVFTATSNNTDIVSVAIENTVTEGNTTTAELVFTYNGVAGDATTALISILAENPNAESGSIDFEYVYDLILPDLDNIGFYTSSKRRLGAEPGEVVKIVASLTEPAGPSTINISGWGTPLVGASMEIDPENDHVIYYNYVVPTDATKSESKITVAIQANDFSGNESSFTTYFVIADQRKPQGGGSSFNPYEVASVGNLSWVFDTGSPASQIFFKQTQDLDLLGYTWESKVNFNRVNFNRNEYTLNNFNYDGGGFSINNLLLDETVVFQDPHTSGFGLFGGMDNGSITNLTIDNAQLRIQNSGTTALNNIGILSGYMSSSFLNNVSVKNSSIDIYSGPNISNVGGISGSVGYMGLIKEVSSENNSITVRGVAANSSHQSSQVGGVFGNMNWNNARADISKIYSTNVSIDLARRAEHVGGLIGRAEYLFWYEGNNGENYSMNEVYAENFEIRITEDTKTNWNWSSSIGGLIGSTYEQDNGPIKTPELQNAFATGKIYITSPNYVGGLIGHSQNSGIKNVYAKVDIIVDLGNLSDWTSFSYGWLNDMRAGGLFGYYSYDGMPLSTSYSASNVVIQRVGFDEDQFANYFNGTNSNGRIGAIASTLDGFAAEAITNSVFYDSEVYTFNQESIGKQNQIDTPNLTSSAVGKQTADMKLIATYSDANWSISDTNATSAAWGINASLNEGYPYFNFNTANLYLPSLSLVGAKSIYMLLGDEYQELGATATDYLGNDITNNILVDTSNLDKETEGNYSIFYDVSDDQGNQANTQLRNIKVRSQEYFKPVMTLVGESSITHEKGDEYTDQGALARNYLDQDISYRVVVTGAVDIAEVGTYALYYDVTDSYGNIGNQIIRTITVEDTSIELFRPTITLNGSRSVVIKEGVSYQELGATAIDYNGSDISSDIIIDASAVAVNSIGTYAVKYDVVDQEGYNAITVTRTVIVKEAAYFKPTVSLVGDAEITLTVGQDYREFGATAIDYNGNNISELIVTTGNVDMSTSGTYVVKYNVTDTLGNIASEIRRTITVNIVDGSYDIPTVMLNGDQTIYMTVNEDYIELGATATDYLGNDISQYIEINDFSLDVNNLGIYYILYTVVDNEGGKSEPAIRIIVVQDVLGVSDVEIENQIAVYPNPTADIINIKSNDYTFSEVYNLIGKKLMTSTDTKFSLAKLGTGVYFIKVNISLGKFKLFKVVVK